MEGPKDEIKDLLKKFAQENEWKGKSRTLINVTEEMERLEKKYKEKYGDITMYAHVMIELKRWLLAEMDRVGNEQE